MELDLEPFIDALKARNTKKAREWLEQNKGRFDPGDEFERGYMLALQGMVVAQEAGAEQAVIKRLVNGEYGREKIGELFKEMKGGIPRRFRPKDEQGFDAAWMDVIKVFSGAEG